MKAILIARVSTEEQKEAGNSLPARVARLERYCQNNSDLLSISIGEL
jgi:predicted site-specific integrase-resolvase